MNNEQEIFDFGESMAEQAQAEYEQQFVQQQSELSANSILSLFDTTREQRASFAMQIIDDIQEGRKDPRLVHLQIKAMEDVIALLTDEKKYPTTAKTYRDYLMSECQKWGKDFEFHNAKFNIKATGGKADYSQCNDTELSRLEWEAETAANKLKEHQKYLQNLPIAGVSKLDESTGELVRIYPAAKPKGETISVTFPK